MAATTDNHDADRSEDDDAGRNEISYYAGGSIESGLTGQFLGLLQTLLIIALGMSPVLLGLILSIKTMWAALCDPVVAHVSDHAATRWGRRKPFILFGSLARTAALVAMVAFFPRSPEIVPNATLDAGASHTMAQQDTEVEEAPLPTEKIEKPLSFSFSAIRGSVDAFASSESTYKRKVAIYVLVCSLVFTTLGSIANIPYYALGLEMCQSYDGRTRLIACRSLVDKSVNLIFPWILPFCLLPFFHVFLDGLLLYALLTAMLGIPATLLMVCKTRERASLSQVVKKHPRPSLLKSFWMTARNIHFLKILFLYQFFGYAIGVFAQLGMFLNIYWVYSGNALAGATLNGYTGTFATLLTFLSLPLVTWACRRFQKHRALRAAILWMALGAALRWVLITPEYPFLQLLIPVFFSIGISSFYMILSTMMADVTDIDELRNGSRREATFGAVMGFCMKLTGTLQPVLAGAVLVASGFNVTLGADQTEQTFRNMRLLFSFVPAGLLLPGLLVLWRYPLTRERSEQIKRQLAQRRASGV